MVIRVSDFVKRVPQAAKAQLPRELQNYHVFLMPWLSQVYYSDKLIHYEIVKLPSKYGENRLEIGLHFESRDKTRNTLLLTAFERRLFEIRAALGDDWCAEPWDRGWTKVYTTAYYQTMDDELLDDITGQLVQAIRVLQPLYRLISKKEIGS